MVSEDEVLQEWHGPLIQRDRCPYRKGRLGPRQTGVEGAGRETMWRGERPEAPSFPRTRPDATSTYGFLPPEPRDGPFLWFEPPSLGPLLRRPQQTNTLCNSRGQARPPLFPRMIPVWLPSSRTPLSPTRPRFRSSHAGIPDSVACGRDARSSGRLFAPRRKPAVGRRSRARKETGSISLDSVMSVQAKFCQLGRLPQTLGGN